MAIQREKRLCVTCNTQIGDTDHFLRGCEHLSTAICSHWTDAPKGDGAGAWWRSFARSLDVRWHEKCSVSASPSDVEFDDEFHGFTEWDKKAASSGLFLDPGQNAPSNLTAEFFLTDLLRQEQPKPAGVYGVWLVIPHQVCLCILLKRLGQLLCCRTIIRCVTALSEHRKGQT